MAQVVEVTVGDHRQALEACLAEDLESTLAQLARGRPRQGAVQGVDLGQQGHILTCATARKWPAGAAAIGEMPAEVVLRNQARHLRPR